jgi:hypothetical protein
MVKIHLLRPLRATVVGAMTRRAIRAVERYVLLYWVLPRCIPQGLLGDQITYFGGSNSFLLLLLLDDVDGSY